MRKLLPISIIITGLLLGTTVFAQRRAGVEKIDVEASAAKTWPVLKRYDQNHIVRIALPLGGIGTGTVSLGGRGDLRDWEIMNWTAKGFVPLRRASGPFFALFTKTADGRTTTRAIEGAIDVSGYEESHGSTVPNHGLPRFRKCSFAAAYPFGQVFLSDADVPVAVRIEAFNPLVPGDAEASGIPVAVLRYVLTNKTNEAVTASICGSIPNFIGMDGSTYRNDWKGDRVPIGAKANRNEYRDESGIRGIFMDSQGVDAKAEQWGTIALTTTAESAVTHRTAWIRGGWGSSLLDFWDDFSDDGRLEERKDTSEDMPMASLAVEVELPARQTKEVTFLLTWHFPNRQTWTPRGNDKDRIGNYYTTKYDDAWDVVEKSVLRLAELERRTVQFVRTFCDSDLPEVVKEAALFNNSTLRTQTCFRTEDGRFFGWEGSSNTRGCCHGSCTHVWNYQLASGCLVDQLVGQYMAHVCGLGYLLDPVNVGATMRGIMKYNLREGLYGHFNCMRSFALGDESALLMASYPKDRPANPFPYFTEVMTGFEYTAAVGMLYEGQTDAGLKCLENIRARYDGRKRNPFNEAECGHHYARAMASWAAVLALTGFNYSGVERSMTFAKKDGTHFWSNGYAWGSCSIKRSKRTARVDLSVMQGELTLSKFALRDFGQTQFKRPLKIGAGEETMFRIRR